MSHTLKIIKPLQLVNITRVLVKGDGTYPNNARLPFLLVTNSLDIKEDTSFEMLSEIFETNGWGNCWENGIYDYHHYHSTAHEAMAVTKGSARIQIGGPNGPIYTVEKGDIIIIPAGVAHRSIETLDNFSVIGAYPEGQDYDMNYGNEEELKKAISNITNLSLPLADPVYGTNGPLLSNWTTHELKNS